MARATSRCRKFWPYEFATRQRTENLRDDLRGFFGRLIRVILMPILSRLMGRWEALTGRNAASDRPVTNCLDLLRLLRAVHGNRVISGPFQGLRYGDLSYGSTHLPKLLGTYERELSGLFSPANLGSYDNFVNLGCAEGYYTNGIAQVLKETAGRRNGRVIGIDLNEQALAESRKISALNGLQVAVAREFDFRKGLCGPGKTLVICDVEGGEIDLIDPAFFGALSRTDFIIETHDGAEETAILDELLQRFSLTHEASVLSFTPRAVGNFPPEILLPVDDRSKLEAMDEGRVKGLRWLNLKSKPQ